MSAPATYPIDISIIRKSARESIAVRICEYEGRPYVDIRTLDIASGSKPAFTKKGCTVRPAVLGELIAALQDAQNQARQLGLLDVEGGR